MNSRFISLMEAAGRRLMSLRGSTATQGVWIGTQLKTPADDDMHAFLARGLREIDPGIPVISEEAVESHSSRRPSKYWLIDPIDGTASFSGGYAGFVTQAALIENSRPILGTVVAPALELSYFAERGRGSRLNGRSLVLAPAAHRRYLIDNYPKPAGVTEKMYDALSCTGYVESGSIGLKICRIADGTADVFFKDVTVRDWDVAPAHLILEEAGGQLCGLDGRGYSYEGELVKTGVLAAASSALVIAAVSCYAAIR